MANDLSKGATFAVDEFTENTDYHDLVDNGGVTAIDRDGFNLALASPITVGSAPSSPSDNEFILDDGLTLQKFDLANAVFVEVDVNTASSLLTDMKVKTFNAIPFGNFARFQSSEGMSQAIGDAGERVIGISSDLAGVGAGVTGGFTGVGLHVVRTTTSDTGTWAIRGEFMETTGDGAARRATSAKTLRSVALCMSNIVTVTVTDVFALQEVLLIN